MIKVILVEDEYVVREGIKRIDWASHGYEFCGEAPDGEMALPMIRKYEPDIVITDIKMPFMDGLVLTRQIRKEFPYTEIIILSGYEEFGYAREAISLGVSKYLTKPIGAQELLGELDELKAGIEKKQRDRESDLQYRRDMAEDVLKSRREFFSSLIGGTHSVAERLSEISHSYDSAGAAFAHRFFDVNNNVRCAEDGMSVLSDASGQDDVQIKSIVIRNADRQRLSDFLKTGDPSETEFFVKEFLRNLGGEASLQSLLFRQYLTMDVYFAAADFVTGLGLDREELEAPDSSAEITMTPSGVEEYCRNVVSRSLSLRDNVSHNKYKDVVDKVIKYIEENYSDEELTLNKLADVVMFSPNHLSMIFSQQTGSTLSRYLIDYRIGKAKEALKCTSKKSSEIALEIGYRDPHYFSYVFKKATGLTPTQYRDGADHDQQNA